jgi:dolichol-phosphate mannosyltransferase
MDRSIYKDLPGAERYRVNIAPLETLFEGLVGVPGSRLIHTSSAWVLGAGDGLDESARLDPRSAHAENKAQVDRLLPILHEKTGVPWINLRLFNIFGKYEHPSRLLPYLVSRFTQGRVAKLSHGDQVRDFNDVEDIARAYLLALQADESACGTVYHIGSGRGTSVRDFAMKVADVTGNSGVVARALGNGALVQSRQIRFSSVISDQQLERDQVHDGMQDVQE